MNLSLRDVVCTSRDGDKFWKIPECYIRGNNIKYLRVPDEVIDKVVEEPKSMCPSQLGTELKRGILLTKAFEERIDVCTPSSDNLNFFFWWSPTLLLSFSHVLFFFFFPPI